MALDVSLSDLLWSSRFPKINIRGSSNYFVLNFIKGNPFDKLGDKTMTIDIKKSNVTAGLYYNIRSCDNYRHAMRPLFAQGCLNQNISPSI